MTETRICDSTRLPAGATPAGANPAGATPAGPTPGGAAPAGPTPADATPAGTTPAGATGAAGPARPAAGDGHRADVLTSLRPLAIDVGVPLGSFYLLHDVAGVTLWLSLALTSILPAARAVAGFAAERRANLLALLMLAVNLAGIVISFLTGDPPAMIAKDSLVSSVIAIAILASVALRRPLMSTGLKPFMTKEIRSGPPRGTACPPPRAGSAGSS